MRKVVLDCETANTFQDVGSNKPSDLTLSLLVLYDYADDTYHTFLEKDLPALWRILEKTDLIIGYNSDHFDIPLLDRYYPGDLTRIPSLDLMVEIKESWGRRPRLDAVAQGTLGVGKSGSGLDAIVWWKNGEVEKIEKYCQQDVKVTKEIYEYALAHKHLKVKDITGIQEFAVNTSHWDKRRVTTAMNYTLPF